MAGLASAFRTRRRLRDMLLPAVPLYKRAGPDLEGGEREEDDVHRSKLSTFIIDCQGGDLDVAAAFWSRALGRAARPMPGEDNYRELQSRPEEPILALQQVAHPPRIHLDIESDDLDAEVKRLEALGAKRIAFVKRWWVMEAPTGHRFCIVNPQRGPIGSDGNEWP